MKLIARLIGSDQIQEVSNDQSIKRNGYNIIGINKWERICAKWIPNYTTVFFKSNFLTSAATRRKPYYMFNVGTFLHLLCIYINICKYTMQHGSTAVWVREFTYINF